MGLLDGRVCVVTGAGRGIGAAIAKAFAREGGITVVACRDEGTSAEATVSAIRETGGRADADYVDVRDLEAVESLFARVHERYGRLDVLANNAGVVRDGLLATQTNADWAEVLDTNLLGTVHGVRAALRWMIPRRSGTIVNVSSIAARSPHPGQSNYAASKGAVEAFTRAMAVELAPRRIRVNAVAPGFVETAMSAEVLSRKRADIEKSIPLGRLGLPDEIAEAVVFLASDRASYITGQVLTVDGGRSL
jgi:3-oxoacyl-[acyl-carrier protein] reductase